MGVGEVGTIPIQIQRVRVGYMGAIERGYSGIVAVGYYWGMGKGVQ